MLMNKQFGYTFEHVLLLTPSGELADDADCCCPPPPPCYCFLSEVTECMSGTLTITGLVDGPVVDTGGCGCDLGDYNPFGGPPYWLLDSTITTPLSNLNGSYPIECVLGDNEVLSWESGNDWSTDCDDDGLQGDAVLITDHLDIMDCEEVSGPSSCVQHQFWVTRMTVVLVCDTSGSDLGMRIESISFNIFNRSRTGSKTAGVITWQPWGDDPFVSGPCGVLAFPPPTLANDTAGLICEIGTKPYVADCTPNTMTMNVEWQCVYSIPDYFGECDTVGFDCSESDCDSPAGTVQVTLNIAIP